MKRFINVKYLALALVIVAALGISLAPPKKVGATPVPVTLNPSVDTYVDASNGNTAYGSSTVLNSGGGLHTSFLRFDVPSVVPAGKLINSATLSLYVTNNNTPTVGGISVFATDNSWGNGSTYNNTTTERATCNNTATPAPIPLVTSSPAAAGATKVITLPLDSITPGATLNYCIVYATASSALQYASNEATISTQRPLLSMTYTTPNTASDVATVDTMVNSNSPTTSYGSSNPINADGGWYTSFLRFNISNDVPTNASFSSATLSIYPTNNTASTGGVSVYAIDDAWSGSSTYNSSSSERSACVRTGTALVTSAKPTANTPLTITLPTSSVSATGDINLCLIYSVSGSGLQYSSMEDSTVSHRPTLNTSWSEAQSNLYIPTDSTLTDSSGWAVSHLSNGIRWSVSDRTYQQPRAWALDASGNTFGKVTMTGTGMTNIDAEDVATVTMGGTPYVYVEDGGGNIDVRTSISVHRFVEPSTAAITAATGHNLSVAADTWTFTYPTGTGGEFDPSRTRGPDSEAMLVDPQNNNMYFIIKEGYGQVGDDGSNDPAGVGYYGIYAATDPAAASTPGTYALTKVAQLPTTITDGGGVNTKLQTTAATFSPDGQEFVLRTYDRLLVYKNTNDDVLGAINAGPSIIIQPTTKQSQGEGASFSADGRAMELSTEEHPGSSENFLRMPLPAAYQVNALTGLQN